MVGRGSPKILYTHDSLLIKYKTTKMKIHNFRYMYKCNKTIRKGKKDLEFRMMVPSSAGRKGEKRERP